MNSQVAVNLLNPFPSIGEALLQAGAAVVFPRLIIVLDFVCRVECQVLNLITVEYMPLTMAAPWCYIN